MKSSADEKRCWSLSPIQWLHQEDIPLYGCVQCFSDIRNYVHASLYPRFIHYLGLYRQTPSTHCCCALYAGTIKQLHQGCHLESAFPRPPLSQWLRKLCLSSLEITGKMWISELFNLVAKFSPVLLLTKTNLSRTVCVATSNKGHRIEGHQIYKQMENNFLK